MTKIEFRTLHLTDDLVATDLTATVERAGRVTLDPSSRMRGARRYLRLYHDQMGYYVRRGGRGSCKQYLGGRCEVMYMYGEPIMYRYTLA